MEENKINGALVLTSCSCKHPVSEADIHTSENVGVEPNILNGKYCTQCQVNTVHSVRRVLGIVRQDDNPYFQNKRTVVSGAVSELGKKLIWELMKQGAKVIALGGQQEELLDLKKSCPHIEIIAADLRNWKQTETSLSNIGVVDFLVNCTEVNAVSSVADVTEEDVNNILNTNLRAAINVSRIVIKSFIENSIRGSIVNVSSQASKIGLRKQSLFCASKAGLDGYTRAAALELASLGIRINCVNPTVLTTELNENIWSDKRMSDALLSRIPMKKFCELQDVVDAIMFLLSDNASFITGICLSVDGGISTS